MTGDWDAAEAELAQAIDGDGLADIEGLACFRAWVVALRGETPAAQATLAGLSDLRTTEDPRDQAAIAVAEAFTAAARGQPAAALRCARTVLGHAGALGISHEYLRSAEDIGRWAHKVFYEASVREPMAALLHELSGESGPGRIAVSP